MEDRKFEIATQKDSNPIESKKMVALLILSKEIQKTLFKQDFNERESITFVNSALKKAGEMEKMTSALEWSQEHPKHPALKDFVRNGPYLERDTDSGDLLRIYFPNGREFLRDILEKLKPDSGYHFPGTWKNHRKGQEELKKLNQWITERFNLSFDIFSKILKLEAIPVTRWNRKNKSAETSEIFLEDLL